MSNLKIGKILLSIALLFSIVLTSYASEMSEAQQIFKKKCSLCHAVDRKKLGPAVKTMSQEKSVLSQVITQGKNAMPAFEGKLSSDEIKSMVDYLLSQQ